VPIPYCCEQSCGRCGALTAPWSATIKAIQELVAFGYAADEKEAASLALNAGLDVEMGVNVPSINSTYTNFGLLW